MTVELLLLRLIHVLGGVFWVGSAVFTTLFLVPALAASGADTGQIFAALAQRRLFTVLPSVALLTIASGLRLLWIASAGFAPSYFGSATGRTFACSGGAAIGAFLLSALVARPTSIRAGRLGSSLANAPDEQRARVTVELATLRRRGAAASAAAVTLLVLGAAGMSVARYLV
ncbi:MAG TPA: hypothetical protein VK636_09830 [Gemmatimonadaceae bacterium]|nr:hypothetical protein [Gemmatimonadaceae bacterium]